MIDAKLKLTKETCDIFQKMYDGEISVNEGTKILGVSPNIKQNKAFKMWMGLNNLQDKVIGRRGGGHKQETENPKKLKPIMANREVIDINCYEMLRNAIIVRAVQDYRYALRTGNRGKVAYFTKWFKNNIYVDAEMGEYILKMAKQKEEVKKR